MLNKSFSIEQPERITYVSLGDEADIWLRKDILSHVDEIGETYYTADEAYMRSSVSLAQIEEDFDLFYEKAALWRVPDAPAPLSVPERIEAIERENAQLSANLIDTQLALCELYEMIGG